MAHNETMYYGAEKVTGIIVSDSDTLIIIREIIRF